MKGGKTSWEERKAKKRKTESRNTKRKTKLRRGKDGEQEQKVERKEGT